MRHRPCYVRKVVSCATCHVRKVVAMRASPSPVTNSFCGVQGRSDGNPPRGRELANGGLRPLLKSDLKACASARPRSPSRVTALTALTAFEFGKRAADETEDGE